MTLCTTNSTTPDLTTALNSRARRYHLLARHQADTAKWAALLLALDSLKTSPKASKTLEPHPHPQAKHPKDSD